MASICRSGAAAAARYTAGGSTKSIALLRSGLRLGGFASSPGVFSSSLLRRSIVSCSALGSVVEFSLMPLHSAEASARHRCLIAVDSSSWNWLTQG